MACDGSAVPLDYDGDGLPDYFEDRDGDGTQNAGDLGSWQLTDSDGDGMSDHAEWLLGRNAGDARYQPDEANLNVQLQVFTPSR